jgi:thiol-disulfide isomerase/thioredoxin
MAVVSSMLPLGTVAPEFTLTDVVSGRELSFEQLASDRATVVMFLCVHCPYVKHVDAELVRLAHEYTARGVSFIAISSNDVERYPDDSPENMKRTAEALGYPFPYLYDETQDVARAFQAACTPDFYVFDGARRLVYRGQLDDSRPANDTPVSGRDLRAALDAVLDGRHVSDVQIASIGCGIKWKGSSAL